MADRSPAQLYASVAGVALLAAGILGFFWSGSFGSPGDVSDIIGLLAVNGWHNVVHVASGAVGLACAPSRKAARAFAGSFGLVYLVVAIWGFALGGSGTILGFLPVNVADDLLHLALGLLGLAAAAFAHEPRPLRPRLAP